MVNQAIFPLLSRNRPGMPAHLPASNLGNLERNRCRRHLICPVPNRTPMVVKITLTANNATTHSTRVSLTAMPTPLAPPPTVKPR